MKTCNPTEDLQTSPIAILQPFDDTDSKSHRPAIMGSCHTVALQSFCSAVLQQINSALYQSGTNTVTRKPFKALSGKPSNSVTLQPCRFTSLRILFLLLIMDFWILFPLQAQVKTIPRPNFSFSSHETLELESIELDQNQTTVHLSILNRKIGGTFCIDKNAVIKNSLGPEEYPLIESVGVPDCPDVHKFSIVGKKLSFILIFPPISRETKYIDIMENCQEACLSIRYILLDEEINVIINQGLNLYENRKMEESLQVFEDLLVSRNDNKSPVFGTIYLYMINLNYELGRSKEIRRLFDELQRSSIINKDEIVDEIRLQDLVR